ncbi:MAG: glycosyltransferase [Alphaproteobacteria bacterium]|jgi:hypothetical protein
MQYKIGAIGRLAKEKGFDVLLQAMAILIKENLEVSLVIGGEGAEEKNLKNLAQSLNLSQKVEFLGWVNDLPSFFEKIDIFIVPSKTEPFGLVFLEAMQYKKPIISSNTDGANDILEDGKTALIFNNGDAKDLANKIKHLLSNKKLQQSFIKNASLKLRDYSFKKVQSELQKYLSINFSNLDKARPVLNITYNSRQGGLEKAFLNYNRLFESLEFQVINLVPKNAKFIKVLKQKPKSIIYSRFINISFCYFFYKFYLRGKFKKIAPSLIIAHNARFANLLLSATNIPIIFINHGGSVKKMLNGKYFFTVNKRTAKELEGFGKEPSKIAYIPNFLE